MSLKELEARIKELDGKMSYINDIISNHQNLGNYKPEFLAFLREAKELTKNPNKAGVEDKLKDLQRRVYSKINDIKDASKT